MKCDPSAGSYKVANALLLFVVRCCCCPSSAGRLDGGSVVAPAVSRCQRVGGNGARGDSRGVWRVPTTAAGCFCNVAAAASC